jgi:glycosyltransferase involved in cell wall biosynthesis
VTSSIHQVLVGAAPGDAITEMARRLRAGLQSVGASEIYAFGIDAGTDPAIRPLQELPPPDGSSMLVYHSSYGRPEMTDLLARRRQRLVLVHHNVTPSKYFIEHDPAFAVGLEWARTELTHLRDRVALAIAVSEYNRRDLEALGYRDVRVVHAGLEPMRLLSEPSDHAFEALLARTFPGGFVLGVSQLLPHKRQDTLIGAMHLVQYVHQHDLGLALIGPARMAGFAHGLERFAESLRVRPCWIVGRATDRQLAAAYRMADVFVSTSEHEGLGIPPLEAMAFGVPAIVRGAGGVPEAVGSAGLVLPEEAGPELFAEAIVRIRSDRRLRDAVVGAGHRRAAAVSAEDSVGEVVSLISQVMAR